MGRRPCQPANRARWTRKRMRLPKGATKRKRRRPSILEGFVVSGSTLAPSLIAASAGMASGCFQNHTFLRHLIALARNSIAGSWKRHQAAPKLSPSRLNSSGRSACHTGKQTRGICIQLAAPDAQSNAAKEEKFYDRVHLEQAEASLCPQTTDSTR